MEDISTEHLRSWEFASSDALAAHTRRRDFAKFLRRFGTPDSDYEAAEMIFGELVANVVRHAPGEIVVRVDWDSASPTLHVHDCGAGFRWHPALPQNPLTESQRGLFIIQALGVNVEVRTRGASGTCVSVVLPVARRIDVGVS